MGLFTGSWLRELSKALFQLFGLTPGKAVTWTINGQMVDADGVGVSVDETELAFTDVTTANADATKHGLLPKLPDDPNVALDGQGNFSTIDTILGYTPANNTNVNEKLALREGNNGVFPKTTSGAQTHLPAKASNTIALIVVTVTETFSAGDGAAPVFDIGETDTPEKFMANINSGTLGDVLVVGDSLSATKDLLVTGTAATGTTSTGAIRVAVLVLPLPG